MNQSTPALTTLISDLLSRLDQAEHEIAAIQKELSSTTPTDWGPAIASAANMALDAHTLLTAHLLQEHSIDHDAGGGKDIPS